MEEDFWSLFHMEEISFLKTEENGFFFFFLNSLSP